MNADESIELYRAISGDNSINSAITLAEKEEFIFKKVCPIMQEIAGSDFPIIVITLEANGALAIHCG
jgi:hypothetical protein